MATRAGSRPELGYRGIGFPVPYARVVRRIVRGLFRSVEFQARALVCRQ